MRLCFYLLQILAIATAYFVTGKLGSYLAIPPGYATAIWPASGIALAGILLFGYRAWPGVLLGSILVNFSTSFSGGTSSELITSSLVTFAIGGGATLQAVAGAWLLRCFAGFPNQLESEKEVFSFMFFGGVLSTLINSSIAVITLVVAGRIPLSNALANWVTWWAGDAIGVFIFTPLVLVWALRPATFWRKRRIVISFTILIVFALTTLLASYASKQEKQSLTLEFEKDSAAVSAMLEKSISLHLNVLRSIERFYSSSFRVEKHEFKAFTEQALNNSYGIQALSWNPYVLSSERVAFERMMRDQVSRTFEISERDGNKQLVRAGNRAEYVPVGFIEPTKGNENALGYDVYSDEIRREAINRARDTGEIATTARISLVQERGNQFGVLAFMPIYRHDVSNKTIAERRRNIKGYAVAVFRGGDIVNEAFKDTHLANLVYKLVDTSAPAGEQLLYVSDSVTENQGQQTIDIQEDGLFSSGFRLYSLSSINVGGRNWQFEVIPTQDYVAGHRTDTTWYILLVGLLFTSMTGAIVLIVTGRENVLRAMVETRTAELQASYNHLYKWSQQVPGVIYQFKLSADGHFSFPYASEGIRDIYEVTPELVHDNAYPVLRVLHPDDYDAVIASIQASARDMSPWKLEYRVKLARQGVQWLQGLAHPEKLDDGSILWHGFITNITERKNTEAMFHGIFEQSSFLAGILDQHGNLINVNKTALSLTSVSREGVIGQYFPDTPWWSNAVDRTQLIEALKCAYAGKYASFEATHPTLDGGYINVLFSATPIVLENGIYVSVTGINITQRKATESRLRMLTTAIEQGPASVVIADLDAQLEYVNSRFTQVTGYGADEVIGKNPRILQSGLTKHSVYLDMWKKLVSGERWVGELVNKRKSGEVYYEEAYISPVKGDDGAITHYVAVKLDITERRQAEENLRIAAIVFESQEGMLVTDANSVILRVNSAFSKITGYSAEEVIGQTPRLLSSGRHSDAFYATMWTSINSNGVWEGEVWNRRKDGEVYPEHLTVTAVKDPVGVVTNYVATLTDITVSKAASEEIKNLAFYDPLTQLPNRRLLIDRLKQALASSARSKQRGALLFLDLDHFKVLNDTLGHDVGDLLLQQVAIRLSNCVREGDTVARIGGDEFVVLLEDLSEQKMDAAAQTEVIANKILLTLNQPYLLATHDYQNSPSIGATLFSDHELELEDLLKQADIAMYDAKKAGRNTVRFFDPKMQEVINNRAEMERDLRNALDRKELQLYYQVQVDDKGTPLGAEALIRWQHPEHGLVSPNYFIPLAEETGLILPIGLWVLDAACAQLKAWEQDSATRDLEISINVSTKQFNQQDFVKQVQATIQRHDINPKLLKLELTESMLIDNLYNTIVNMVALQVVGVRFELDDFGTGYSSLQYLKQLPLYQLKIDQSFVQDIESDDSDRTLIHTIINMANSLGLEVIAEGVETEQQYRFLLDNGCIHFQGYLFGKPMPIDAFEAMLRKIQID